MVLAVRLEKRIADSIYLPNMLSLNVISILSFYCTIHQQVLRAKAVFKPLQEIIYVEKNLVNSIYARALNKNFISCSNA